MYKDNPLLAKKEEKREKGGEGAGKEKKEKEKNRVPNISSGVITLYRILKFINERPLSKQLAQRQRRGRITCRAPLSSGSPRGLPPSC